MKPYQVAYFTILVLGLVVGFIKRKNLNQSSRISTALVAFTLFFELIASYERAQRHSNLWVYHVLLPIQFVLVTASYFVELRNKLMIPIVILFVVFSAVSSLFIQVGQFPSYAITVSSLFYILWILLFFRELLLNKEPNLITAYPLFWVSCGWLQFCLVNLFPFGTFNQYLQGHSEDLKVVFKNIRIGSNLILYGCYLVAILSKQVVSRNQ
jgi:hypothetical protein